MAHPTLLDIQVEHKNEPPVGGESGHCDILSCGSWATTQHGQGSQAATSGPQLRVPEPSALHPRVLAFSISAHSVSLPGCAIRDSVSLICLSVPRATVRFLKIILCDLFLIFFIIIFAALGLWCWTWAFSNYNR